MLENFKKGVLISYISLSLNIIIGIFLTPWIIGSVGMKDYGLYVMAMSVVNFFVFDYGFGIVVQRFVSKYLAENRLDKVNEFLSITWKIFIYLDIFVVVVLFSVYFFIPDIYKGLSIEDLDKFRFIYAVVAIFSIFSVPFLHLDATILAHEKILYLKLCDLAHQIITIGSMTLLLAFNYGIKSLVFVSVLAGVLRILLKLAVLKQHTSVRINWAFWDRVIFYEILSFTLWTSVYLLFQRLGLVLAPSILGSYQDSKGVAIFGIVMLLEGFFFLFANVLNGLFLPKVSRLYFNHQSEEILNLMIRVGRIQLILTSFVYLGLICFGRQFIDLWVGSQFYLVYSSAILMILPSFIGLAQNIGITALISSDNVKHLTVSSTLQVVTYFISVIPLIRFYGVYGLSCSIFLSYSISIIYNNFIYSKVLNISMRKYYYKTFVEFVPLFVLGLLIGFFIDKFVSSEGYLGLLIKIGSFVLIYFPILYKLFLTENERIYFFGNFNLRKK